MSFIIALLTVFLVLNSLLLILLVLVQLPKKDAGAGLAFGSGAADALFGAGSGNALTKITKWGTGIFIGVAILIGLLQDHAGSGGNSAAFLKDINQKVAQQTSAAQAAQPQMPPANPASGPQQPANSLLSTAPLTTNNTAK